MKAEETQILRGQIYSQDTAHWAGFAMSTREDRLASAAQLQEWLKNPGQATAEAALSTIKRVIAVFNCMKAIRRENQADDLFGRVRILLQVPSDMQYELILIL